MLTKLLILGCLMLAQNTGPGFTSLVAPATKDNPRHSEGSVIELKDGTLLLAWSRFHRGAHDNATAHIAAMTSKDGGKTWGAPYVLQENTGKQNVMSVSLLRLKSGKIGMWYLEKNSDTDLQVCMRLSGDEGKTWTEPRRVTSEGYNIMNNDRVIQLSSGRLICPISYAANIWKHDGLVCFCVYSDDEGKTWHRSSPEIRAPQRGAMEPGVVELATGDMLMVIRTQMGCIYKSISRDKGRTWSEAEPMEIVAPEAPSTIVRVPKSRDLLLVWNSRYEPGQSHGGRRAPLTAAISRDNGKTWVHRKDIEANEDKSAQYAYTSITFVKDQVLLSYYEAPDLGDISLRFRSIPLKWFYSD